MSLLKFADMQISQVQSMSSEFHYSPDIHRGKGNSVVERLIHTGFDSQCWQDKKW